MPNFAKIHAHLYFAFLFLSSWAPKFWVFTSQGRRAGPTDGLLMREPLFHLVSGWMQLGLFLRIVLGRGGLFVASYYSVSVLCRWTRNKPADAQSIFYASLPNKYCKFLLSVVSRTHETWRVRGFAPTCGQTTWSESRLEPGLEYVPPPFAQILLIHLLHFHHASLTSCGGKGNTK